jgi:hypothetical protein
MPALAPGIEHAGLRIEIDASAPARIKVDICIPDSK